MKYLIIEKGNTTEALLFGGTLSHKELKHSLEPSCKVIGAGICSFNWSPDDCGWKVHLRKGSDSLNMETKKDDEFWIRHALNN